MIRFRYPVNILLYFAQLGPSLYLVYYLVITGFGLDPQWLVNFVFIAALAVALVKNKNLFTLLLGFTLLVGNFTGLSAFVVQNKQAFYFGIGALHIPLYWGAPFYSLLLLVYLVFNKGFYTGILTKEYWNGFLTRDKDLEIEYTTVTPSGQEEQEEPAQE